MRIAKPGLLTEKGKNVRKKECNKNGYMNRQKERKREREKRKEMKKGVKSSLKEVRLKGCDEDQSLRGHQTYQNVIISTYFMISSLQHERVKRDSN